MIQEIQGMGVTLETHGISQVSMNILDVNKCQFTKRLKSVAQSLKIIQLIYSAVN